MVDILPELDDVTDGEAVIFLCVTVVVGEIEGVVVVLCVIVVVGVVE